MVPRIQDFRQAPREPAPTTGTQERAEPADARSTRSRVPGGGMGGPYCQVIAQLDVKL